MGSGLKQSIYEWVRCSRHNALHLKMLKIRYDGRLWYVRQGREPELKFPYYPYLVALEIEGYLRGGRWRLEPGMTVFDAGACFGEFALYASRQVGPSGRVFMFEPDSNNLRTAADVFALNGGPPANLSIVPVGLWKERGCLSFASGLGYDSSLLAPGARIPPNASVTSIPVESLASFASAHAIPRVDLVKMDIEGAEVPVMESAADFVRQYSPKFAIASYHPLNHGITRDVLEPLFRTLGYQVETGFPKHLTTWAAPTL
jgi:FkbM family methyltransferase